MSDLITTRIWKSTLAKLRLIAAFHHRSIVATLDVMADEEIARQNLDATPNKNVAGRLLLTLRVKDGKR